MVSICRGKFSFTKKIKANQTKQKWTMTYVLFLLKSKIWAIGYPENQKILLNLRQKGYFDQVL